MSRYAIIAGAPKAGTTSLFRYLAGHPSVCTSSIKETNFFIKDFEGTDAELVNQYHSYFQGSRESCKVFLEASPNYLLFSSQAAPLIQKINGSTKLIFVLRDPVARILSYYRSNKLNKLHSGISRLGLEEFVALVEKASCKDNEIHGPGPAHNASLQFQAGCYVSHLKTFKNYFNRSDIHIIFFDELAADPHRVVKGTCSYLDINPTYFDVYTFNIENKSMRYRFPALQPLGGRLNRWAEPILNKYPKVRDRLRPVLLAKARLNYQSEIDEKILIRLREVYKPFNMELCSWLSYEYPKLSVPTWLA